MMTTGLVCRCRPLLLSPAVARQGHFHVFLSFSGRDVRNNYLSHLHHALSREGIRAYVDREDLRSGDEITPSLKKAIWNSRIAIVIFSINYASSCWCLDELAEIMDRKKQGNLIVKLVFYRVEPREMRTPRDSFAKALAAHELKLGKYSHVLRRWREALFEAGNLSGWHLDANGNEAELVKKIVKDVNVVLDCTRLDVAKYPVAIESRVEQIKNLLNLELDVVLVVGIWGMGGVGKTTLAKAVFNAVADHFQGCAFLPNVRKDSVNPSVGLAKLQEKLLSEVLGRNDVNVRSISSGITRIKDRLSQKKVLLLLDDVSSEEQLEALSGGLDWFGNGSGILVTTRDRSLFAAHNVHVVHEVEGLPYNQALQLFSKHAFLENDSPNISKCLVDRCLTYCSGLPLALVNLGSLLRNQDEHHWESWLKLLEQQGLRKEIEKVLRVGFNELDHNAREIFLAIACFFKGETRREIEKAMDACGFLTSLGIDILIEKSLIAVVKDTACGFSIKRVEMHPLLQLMGRNIARHGNPKNENGKHVRQWSVCMCTCHVLSNGLGTNTAKGLGVRSPRPKEDVLPNLKNPILLIQGNAQEYGDPMCSGHKLNAIKRSAYSAPNTFFRRPQNINEQDYVCCNRITRHGPRATL